jgi:DNA-directed RNA polymerase specialized sigma24 family protein
VGSEDLDGDLAAAGFPIHEPLVRPEVNERAPIDPQALVKEFETFQSAVSEESVALEDVYTQDTVRDCVRAGVRRFKAEEKEQRYIALLLRVHGWSMEEIGAVLGRTASATKVFLFECRKKIAPYIVHCWELSLD